MYAPGKWNSHLSDDVAAFALIHSGADRRCMRRSTRTNISTTWQRSLAAASLVGKQVTTIAADGSTVSGVVQRAALTTTAASVVIGGLTGPASTAGPGGVWSSHHYGGRSLCTTRGATHSGHVFSSVRLNLFSSAA